jgi:hypothetical protein
MAHTTVNSCLRVRPEAVSRCGPVTLMVPAYADSHLSTLCLPEWCCSAYVHRECAANCQCCETHARQMNFLKQEGACGHEAAAQLTPAAS